jgi:hypothetical protein
LKKWVVSPFSRVGQKEGGSNPLASGAFLGSFSGTVRSFLASSACIGGTSWETPFRVSETPFYQTRPYFNKGESEYQKFTIF